MDVESDRQDDRLLDLIASYRRRLPVPRYWLRRSVVVALVGLWLIAGLVGLTPTIPELLRHYSVRVEAFVDGEPDKILTQMVADGEIRPARQSDIDQWVAAAKLTAEERSNASLHADHAFVVLKEIRVPRNMYGAHSRDFYIPAGVSPPTGDMAHKGYYFLETGTCLEGVSSICGR